MKAVALKWWISLAVIACIGLASGVAFAQNGQGLAAVGAISPANPFPRWYMDRSGLQLGQCLDTTNPADPCVLGIVAGSPAPNVLPNPALPLSFPGNFPTEFFYWRATATITGVGGLNDVLGQPSISGFCGTCHDTPHSGNHSVKAPLNIG